MENFLDKVTLLDNVKGTVEHLFEYVTGSLTDVTFDVFAAEDIKAADGVSKDYYKADEKVGNYYYRFQWYCTDG